MFIGVKSRSIFLNWVAMINVYIIVIISTFRAAYITREEQYYIDCQQCSLWYRNQDGEAHISCYTSIKIILHCRFGLQYRTENNNVKLHGIVASKRRRNPLLRPVSGRQVNVNPGISYSFAQIKWLNIIQIATTRRGKISYNTSQIRHF